MSIIDEAVNVAEILPVRAKYNTECGKNTAVKAEAFVKKYYGRYAGPALEFKPEEYFEHFYRYLMENEQVIRIKQSPYFEKLCARVAAEMFYTGGQLLWRMYEETLQFTESEAAFRSMTRTAIRTMKFGKFVYKIMTIYPQEQHAVIEKSLGKIYTLLEAEPVSIPQNEEELKEYAKVWFESGFSVMWGYLPEAHANESKKGLFKGLRSIVK